MANPTPEPQKRVITGFEKILLFIAIVILLSFVLQKLGVPIVKRTTETEIIDKPH